jgi:hypothetical protein
VPTEFGASAVTARDARPGERDAEGEAGNDHRGRRTVTHEPFHVTSWIGNAFKHGRAM